MKFDKATENGNHYPSDDSIFAQFWSARGQDCTEIIALMSQKEPWALDNDLGLRLDEYANLLSNGDINDLAQAIEKEDFIQLQAWLSSEKALMFASMLDEANPNLIVEILRLAGTTTDMSEPLRLFSERIVTFSRARLIADIFNIDRVRRIEKLARAVMK